MKEFRLFSDHRVPQQTIYRWEGNLTASRIHFKYWKNILILRLLKYEHIIYRFNALDLEIPLTQIVLLDI